MKPQLSPLPGRALRGKVPQILSPGFAVVASLLVAGLLAFLAGSTPGQAYRSLLSAGFGCRALDYRCALLTTLQFATPLLLSGLSATVAFRAGMFSIGQAGQMIMGAAGATWLASRLGVPAPVHAVLALVGGSLAGAWWGWIPGVLKQRLDVNEVIVTLVMNPIAIFLASVVGFRRIPESARLAVLAHGTKLNTGAILALLAAVATYVYLWRSALGYEQRMAGQAPLFALFGGMHSRRAVVRAMIISGALAGLAGAIEVLGVHYRFVSVFSAGGDFDGLVVALLGQLHPVGVMLAAMLLGGVRLGAINGWQLQTQIPRELGGAMIGVMALIVSSERLREEIVQWVRHRANVILNRQNASPEREP